MKRFLPHAAIAAGLAIFLYAVFFGSSDEDLIREKLDLLAETIEVKGHQENIVVRGARIKDAFADIFTKEVVIEIPELTNVSTGRMELVGLASQAPTWYRTASVDLDSLQVDVDQQGLSAHVSGPVTLTATRLTGELARDRRTTSLRFDKIEDEWKVVSVTVSAKETEEE